MIEQISDAEVFYHLQPDDPAAHVYTVACRIASPDPAGQVFTLPTWAPGSYLIREFARHLLVVEAVLEEGPQPLQKLDKARWRAPVVDGPLVVRARVYAFDLSVRGAWLDCDHGFVNGFCLFLRPEGRDDLPCAVQVDPPEGHNDWQLATAMRRLTGGELEFGAFVAANYDELIDQPLLMGRLAQASFDVLGVTHELVVQGCPEADLDRICTDLADVCTAQAELFGDGLPMSRYSFLTTALNTGYGGLEHRDSCALIASRGDLPRAGREPVAERYRRFLGLCSHEYFHLWNVKRLRPAELTPYALDRENYTRQLWLFEGVTSYYDDLMLARSGVITSDEYLEMLGRSLTRVYRSRGRRVQSLEDASFDAWIKFYRQDENAPNALVSYYTKGAMVSLALDLELRLRTDGRCSLDEVMRALWQEFGAGGGVPQGAFERVAEETSGLRLEEFFEPYLRGTADPPIGILLAQFAVRLRLRAAESANDMGGKAGRREDRPLPWLGAAISADAGRVTVASVLSDGPGIEAGLSAGDEIVAIGGERCRPECIDDTLDRLTVGEPVTLHVFRRDDLRQLELRPARPPRDTAWLELDDEADDACRDRRLSWLGI
jgi:predicted metalloprotease with PDZ domain